MRSSFRHSFYLAIFIFILALAARTIPGPRTIDDSYITYRYARNILAGNGFVYNPGEHVLGTTTPLYTILLTTMGVFTGGINAPFPQIAMLINALADGLMCLLLLFLGYKFKSIYAGIGAALVWAIAPFSVTFAIGGLETSVYVLLLTGAVTAHLSNRHVFTAFLGALALLTRPDALILLIPLAMDRLWQIYKDQQLSKHSISTFRYVLEMSAFFIPVLVWVVFSNSYFGGSLPHSIAAKTIAYRLPSDTALIRLLQHYATPFLGHITFGIPWIGIGLVLYLFLYIVGSRRAWQVNQHSWSFLMYPWLYFAIFAIANPLIFRWYLTPPLPALILFILIGAEKIILGMFKNNLTDHDGTFKHNLPFASKLVLTVGVIIIPMMLSLRGWTLRPDHGLTRPAPEMAWYQLELLYRQAAYVLEHENAAVSNEDVITDDSPLLAAGDVGVLGFYTKMRILDTVGLNSAQTLNYYPLDEKFYVTNYAIPPDLILDQEPDYIVILEVYGREGLLKDPRFQKMYHLIKKIPTDIYGSDGMLIFDRVNSN
jgi:hypothetical protein